MTPTSTEDQRTRRTPTPYVRLPRNGPNGRDVRAKRPPLLSFLLRMETLRRLARIVSLLALDLGGVFLAIYTALALKAALRGTFDSQKVWDGTTEIVAFA